MKVIKRESKNILLEEAHGGSGTRRVYADRSISTGDNLEAITHGYIPVGQFYDWHDHIDIEEIMIVIYGQGVVCDEDGEYTYGDGDVFVFPANVQHKIVNKSAYENEMIFVRVKT